MRNLLAIWRAHRLDRLLTYAWQRGTVLAGLSAGAMCWFEGGVTRSPVSWSAIAWSRSSSAPTSPVASRPATMTSVSFVVSTGCAAR